MNNTLGDKVLLARRNADLSQEDLAVRAGLSRTMINNIENGIRTPSLDTLQRIARALDCTLRIEFESRPVENVSLKDILG